MKKATQKRKIDSIKSYFELLLASSWLDCIPDAFIECHPVVIDCVFTKYIFFHQIKITFK